MSKITLDSDQIAEYIRFLEKEAETTCNWKYSLKIVGAVYTLQKLNLISMERAGYIRYLLGPMGTRMCPDFPEGYKMQNPAPDVYYLVRQSDGEILAKVDSLDRLRNNLAKEGFLLNLYLNDEWEALEAFYHILFRKMMEREKMKGEIP